MKQNRHPFFWNLIGLGMAFVLSVVVGSVFIPPTALAQIIFSRLGGPADVSQLPQAFATILFEIRFPHTALVALTGAALAGSGAAYQGLFRNPLADPYVIGVAAGSGLGAVVGMAVQWPRSILGFYAVPAAAFLGGLLTVALVYNLARVNRALPPTLLILAGVAVSSFATALTTFLMLRSNEEMRRAISWLLGGALFGGWKPVQAVLPYILLGLGTLMLSGHALNVLQFGEEQAQQLGLAVDRAKLIVILAATLTTAAAVAFSGLIGFIGLIVPHGVRFLWGPDYKRLIPLSILGGSSVLLLADLLARVVLAPQTLPVGIVTALAGVPFFLWVLRRTRTQIFW